jgi:hypothetical protein
MTVREAWPSNGEKRDLRVSTSESKSKGTSGAIDRVARPGLGPLRGRVPWPRSAERAVAVRIDGFAPIR